MAPETPTPETLESHEPAPEGAFPYHRRRPAALVPGGAYLDGEIAVLTTEGISDFEALQVAPGRSAKGRWPRGIFLLRERC
jgi:hypothetical protein